MQDGVCVSACSSFTSSREGGGGGVRLVVRHRPPRASAGPSPQGAVALRARLTKIATVVAKVSEHANIHGTAVRRATGAAIETQ